MEKSPTKRSQQPEQIKTDANLETLVVDISNRDGSTEQKTERPLNDMERRRSSPPRHPDHDAVRDVAIRLVEEYAELRAWARSLAKSMASRHWVGDTSALGKEIVEAIRLVGDWMHSVRQPDLAGLPG